MRLIDADALKEQILDWISEQVVSKYISHDACMATREGARVAFNLLNDAPTIDAVPRVPFISTAYYCSNCEGEAYWDTDYGQQLFGFCPNCGARMDGEKHE